MVKNIMCFDIGGTFIKYGVVTSAGQLLTKGSVPTPRTDCGNRIVELVAEKTHEMSGAFAISCIGICTAGLIDVDRGDVIFASDNLPDYSGTPLARRVSELTQLDCWVENDVNAAALGEMWQGAARGLDRFVCLTFGTGVGGSFVINREIHKGSRGIAGWLGHMVINENGLLCDCGRHGCYEQYASTSALIRRYCEAAGLTAPKTNEIDGKHVMSLVLAGDSVARKVYGEFVRHVVTGLVNITYLLDPGMILIGGGISASPRFISDVQDVFREACIPSFAHHTTIKPTQLGNDSGLYGAGYICLARHAT